MPRCDMELCPNWSGDGRVCDCATLPPPPDEDDDPRESAEADEAAWAAATGLVPSEPERYAQQDPLFDPPDWFDAPSARWWDDPDLERSFTAPFPHMAVTPWFRGRRVEDVHLPDEA